MASVKITDNVNLTTEMALREDSILAKAKLTQLAATAGTLFKDFNKPIDMADEKSAALGAMFDSPSLLNDDLGALSIQTGINCGLSIKTAADKLLFEDDGFSPVIPIVASQAWMGVEFDLFAGMSGAASTNGVGVSLAADGKISCATYTLFSMSPLPQLIDAAATAFSNFSLSTSAAAIRKQPAGTVNVTDVSGSVTTSVSFDQPFSLNALASANLPFNVSASIQPKVTLELAGSVEITGDFLVRCYKISDSVARMGIYKKHGTSLSVSLTAAAGIQGKVAGDDVLAMLLKTALHGVDVAAAGITGANAATLNDVIRRGMNRSLSAQVNATCSAAFTHEAALLYDVQLDAGDATATDAALGLALHGNWTSLETLPNARRIRNISVETVEKQRSLTVNLLGFYSAISTTDYLKTCTILVDDAGHVTITDKIDASRISASTSPYAADSDKLRQALMEDFLCTATYAVMSGRLNLDLSVMQSYAYYKRNMSREDMRESVLLGYSLGLIPRGSLDATLQDTPSFNHAYINAVVRYDTAALMSVFYKDPASRMQRTNAELEQAGREAMCALLDPSDPTNAVRLAVLKNPDAWNQMDEIGNVAAFHSIPALSRLGATELAVVSADWISIVWWATAVSRIAPALSAAMDALNKAPADKPTEDPEFLKARAKLSNVLGAVTRNTSAAFVHGWGAAVMFALSGMHGVAEMDLTWNSKNLHFGPTA